MKPKIALMLILSVMSLAAPGMAAGQQPPAPPQPRHPAAPPAMPRHPHPPGPDLGRWWKDSEIVRELALSDAQVKQIEQAFYDHRLKLIDLKADLERQEARLQPLIEADQPDEAKVSAQIDQVLAARGRLEKANAMMMLSIRRVLTVEQWKKLETIKHRHELMRMRLPGTPGELAPAPFERRPPGSFGEPEENPI